MRVLEEEKNNVINFPTSEVTEMVPEPPTFFNIEFKAWHETEGLLASKYDLEETLERTKKEMAEVYGEGNFEIIKIEQVDPETQAALEQSFGYVSTPKVLN